MDEREKRVYEALEQWGIAFETYHHTAAYTMEQCAQFDRETGFGPGAAHCKNLFLCNRQKTQFYLLIVNGDKPFRTADISKQLGISRLSFGPEDKLLEYLGCQPGAIGPMGLLWDEGRAVQVVCDDSLPGADVLLFHPNINTATVSLSPADFFEIYLPHTGHEPRFVTIPSATEAPR